MCHVRVQLVLAEVLGHEFHVTLHHSQTIADMCNIRCCIYAFEMSSTSTHDNTTATDADEFINVIVLSCDAKKARRLTYFSVDYTKIDAFCA